MKFSQNQKRVIVLSSGVIFIGLVSWAIVDALKSKDKQEMKQKFLKKVEKKYKQSALPSQFGNPYVPFLGSHVGAKVVLPNNLDINPRKQ
jgi:hypothetical protein